MSCLEYFVTADTAIGLLIYIVLNLNKTTLVIEDEKLCTYQKTVLKLYLKKLFKKIFGRTMLVKNFNYYKINFFI